MLRIVVALCLALGTSACAVVSSERPLFTAADLSPIFRANGTRYPNSPFYLDQSSDRFARWRVAVNGLVERPLSLSLADIHGLPAREQITRHDCVEGCSAIGKWRGARLAPIPQPPPIPKSFWKRHGRTIRFIIAHRHYTRL